MIMKLLISQSLILSMIAITVHCDEIFSFHKFKGPVSGEEQKIYTPNQELDYEARPDYSYSYGVQDPATGNSQIHKESRDGSNVHGEYRVLQADGLVRIVKYTSDPVAGFQAVVEYEPHGNHI